MNWQSAGRAIWRYKWLALGLTAVLVLATAFIVGRQAPVYETTSTIRILQNIQADDQPALETAQRNAASYSVLVNGSEFSELVAQGLRQEIPDLTAQQVAGTLFAEPIPSTDFVVVTARGGDPERITAIAQAATPALRQTAVQQGGTERIRLADEARIPSDPVAPRTQLAVAVALVMGLIVNSALMVLLDLLRDRFADPDELRAITGRPVLTIVPRLPSSSFAGRAADGATATTTSPEVSTARQEAGT